jgi:hypothetical protein
MISLVPKILNFNANKRTLILKINNESLEQLQQALCLTNGNVGNIKLNFRVLNVNLI